MIMIWKLYYLYSYLIYYSVIFLFPFFFELFLSYFSLYHFFPKVRKHLQKSLEEGRDFNLILAMKTKYVLCFPLFNLNCLTSLLFLTSFLLYYLFLKLFTAFFVVIFLLNFICYVHDLTHYALILSRFTHFVSITFLSSRYSVKSIHDVMTAII